MERIAFDSRTGKYLTGGKTVEVKRVTAPVQIVSGENWGFKDPDKAEDGAVRLLEKHFEEMGCEYYELMALYNDSSTESEPVTGYSVCGPKTTTRYFGIAVGIGYE